MDSPQVTVGVSLKDVKELEYKAVRGANDSCITIRNMVTRRTSTP